MTLNDARESWGDAPTTGVEPEVPVEREPPRPSPAWVTGSLVFANVACAVSPCLLGIVDWRELLAFAAPYLSELGAGLTEGKSFEEPWRLLTSTFLHGGAIHLLGNMIALVLVGSWLEAALGPRRFLGIYLLSGIAGAAASTHFFRPENAATVSVGASGAVLGVAWAVMVFLFRIRNQLPPGMARSGMIRLGIGLAITLVVFPFTDFPIDNWAHFGGSAAGAILGALVPLRSQPHLAWSLVSGMVLAALLGVGVAIPLVKTVEIAREVPAVDQRDVVEELDVEVQLPRGWRRLESRPREVSWTLGRGTRAYLEWLSPEASRSMTPLTRVDTLELQLRTEQERGGLSSYERIHYEDCFGEGVGGVIVAYRLGLPALPVDQYRVRYYRLFDTRRGPATLHFLGGDTERLRELGVEFVRGVRPHR